MTTTEVPRGQTTEIIRTREKIILDFYETWLSVNPEKRIYNADLKTFIYLDYFPVEETARRFARSYRTTLAFCYLTEILVTAKIRGLSFPNGDGKKQSPFQSRFIMPYEERKTFGNISLTVDYTPRNDKKYRYYLTAIKNDDK